jgi:predicted amidohydrolase
MGTLAAVQFKATKGDWDASADRLEATLESVPAAGIIVCPEMALTGYVFPDADCAAQVAEPAAGRTFEFAARIARSRQAFVVIGYPEDAGNGRLFNSALIVGPEGELLYNYRKRLLYESDETWATPGDTPYPLLDTPFGKLTCGICMDLNDEQFIGFLFDNNPDLIAFPTNWLDQGFDVRAYWRWRLAGYPGWLIAANTYGPEEDLRFRGRSAILDPSGSTAAFAPATGDTVITVS